jgi:hypothetical protein
MIRMTGGSAGRPVRWGRTWGLTANSPASLVSIATDAVKASGGAHGTKSSILPFELYDLLIKEELLHFRSSVYQFMGWGN